MMKLVILCTSLTAVLGLEVNRNKNTPSFEDFMHRFNKTYAEPEREVRKLIFDENIALSAQLSLHNSRTNFGMTKFSDLSPAEFAERHGLHYSTGWQSNAAAQLYTTDEVAASPASIDWRAKGAVSAVKDQGHCGSCWAFSTTGNIEGQAFIALGRLPVLSEQELVSCDDGDSGCQGGLMDTAFGWLSSTRSGQLMTESYYPYKSGDGTTRGCGGVNGKHVLCRGKGGSATDAWCTQFCNNRQGKALCTPDLCDCSATGAHAGATISGFIDLPKNEDQLSAWLSRNGPISIGVAVPLGAVWQGYTGGIMAESACPGSAMPNHGVLLVGYDLTEKYWIIKNSWGADFGEKGYIRVEYGSNTCNLVFSPSSSRMSSFPNVFV